jgi:MFS transporter, OCT family, solute carrier family 22 (organic cation transporter), member 4/5
MLFLIPVIEWLGVEHRILASLVLGIPLAMGAATLSLLDYLTGYWRTWARFAYPPSFLLLLYPWLLPESVRWLTIQGRLSEAVDVIKKAAKCNRVVLPQDGLEKMLLNEAEQVNNKVEEIIQDESLFRALIK